MGNVVEEKELSELKSQEEELLCVGDTVSLFQCWKWIHNDIRFRFWLIFLWHSHGSGTIDVLDY